MRPEVAEASGAVNPERRSLRCRDAGGVTLGDAVIEREVTSPDYC
jgi:hypothetical protein